MRSNRSFDADTQRHCAAKRAGELTPRGACRCVPVNFNVRPHMRRVLVFFAFLLPAAYAVYAETRVESYPPTWPALSPPTSSCVEVEGTYLDPNTWVWAREVPSTGEKFDGRLIAAWATFGLPPEKVLANDQGQRDRRFSILIDREIGVTVRYQVGSMPPVDRTFVGEQWRCTPNGLQITVLDRTGRVMDKLPNHGRTVAQVVLRRTGEHLYVKASRSMKARTLWVFPESSEHVEWRRFIRSGTK
jgi:hypothetical protein